MKWIQTHKMLHLPAEIHIHEFSAAFPTQNVCIENLYKKRMVNF